MWKVITSRLRSRVPACTSYVPRSLLFRLSCVFKGQVPSAALPSYIFKLIFTERCIPNCIFDLAISRNTFNHLEMGRVCFYRWSQSEHQRTREHQTLPALAEGRCSGRAAGGPREQPAKRPVLLHTSLRNKNYRHGHVSFLSSVSLSFTNLKKKQPRRCRLSKALTKEPWSVCQMLVLRPKQLCNHQELRRLAGSFCWTQKT